jgi:hypothetical protein
MTQVLKHIANTSVNTFSLPIMSIRPLLEEIWTGNDKWRTNDVPRRERVNRLTAMVAYLRPLFFWASYELNSLTAIGGHDRPLIYELRARVVSLRIFVRYQRLMARKIAELFGLNRGVRPFCAARCFNELSRGSVLCLLNASFKTAFSQRHNSIFWAKIDDHGVRRGNTGQILARWRRPVASRVALDLPYWVMGSAPYRLIRMAIEMAHNGGTFVRRRRLFRLTNRSKIT